MDDSNDIFIFTDNYIAKGEYICQYRSDEGIVCGNRTSKYGYCNWHVSKCHSKANYHRKKMDKMFWDGQTSEALEQALDKMLQQVKLSLESCP
ncbi:hypothetical protein RhiirC2_786054 [Rhizophagus irregularis]|uniref:Uncharacterized protein n=1 Tax=Rhizophagus irregularis TaxID=588596 RepID=A0A2N1MV51_9GLOM|nr:hypothetical protein RhiirC2_786054 [Rhizophagus irregularis]